jgi:branched-chain amino acid transport system substrate-binding protein
MPAPFDALFLPVGGSEAVSLADSLAMYDLDPQTVRRLGTGLWDDAALATQKSLDGAWFAASDPALRKAFERRYYDAYGAAPPRLSTLAYDAMSLAVVLAKSGLSVNGSPAYDRTSIGNPNGFAGSTASSASVLMAWPNVASRSSSSAMAACRSLTRHRAPSSGRPIDRL